MAGTREGAIKSAQKLKDKDPDYFRKLGAKGGGAPTDKAKGFASLTHEKLIEVAARGGRNGARSS